MGQINKSWKNFEEHDRQIRDCLEQTISENKGWGKKRSTVIRMENNTIINK